MLKKFKVKRINGAYGYYDPNTDDIVLSNKLKNIWVPSKELVKHHEYYHAWLNNKKISLPLKEEEIKCFIYALTKTKDKYISPLEALLKTLLRNKYGYLSKNKIAYLDMKRLL